MWQLWAPFRRFRKNPFLIGDGKLMVQDAFILKGIKYYQCATATDLPAGRALSSLFIFDEFRMKCDKDYLDKHVKANEILLSGKSGTIDLNVISSINANLKERINLCAMPEYIYKLASIYFWDDYESPYYYDIAYNRKKIEKWKKDGEALSFFLTQPLRDLIPFSESDEMSAPTFLDIADQIDRIHRVRLQEILSKAR